MDNTIQIKCVMDSEFCKGNTWYKIHSMGEHIIYVYLDKHEFVGLPKCHFDMEHIKITVNGNDMQEKVTLKVGDEISVVGYSTRRITDFKKGKIVLVDNGTSFRMYLGEYYVNGKLYARENIIVPDFKEQAMQKVIHDSDCSLHNEPAYPNGDCDCSVSTQEITKDNILEVLKFNKSLGLEVDNIRIKDNCICFYFNGYEQKFEFDDDGGTKWLQHTEVETGKLKPLPKANPFDVVKVGQWVRYANNGVMCMTENKWYKRTEDLGDGFLYHLDDAEFGRFSRDPQSWDLTDIRDYNPTECELKIGDVIDFGSFGNLPIDEFNYIDECIETNLGGSLICRGFKNLQNNDNKKSQLINGKKYDKITIPPFDFKQTLLDNGFTCGNHGCLYAVGSSWGEAKVWLQDGMSGQWLLNGSSNGIKPISENAQILIQMAKLAQQLT